MSNGSVMGITLGYREANLLYRKVGIVARGLGDAHARQDLDFLVSTATGSASVTPSDAKLTISGLTGYVGIGTTTPAQQLHLTGSIRMPNTTSTTTGIIYKDTSRFIHNYQHPTGDTAVPAGFNTFVGISAGNLSMGSTATAAAEGSYNSGFGYQVLTSLTTGYRNTAVGFKAGNDITTAIDSTLVGMNAGGNIVNGSRNTFIGDDAGFLTTSGANNVAVGARTIRLNTTGSNNTIVGTYALDAHTSPAGHTTLGYSALTNLTTGSYNIAIGYAAGSQKVATGNLTNASYGIYLGYGVDGTEGASGEIVIGKDAQGLGSNTTRLGGSNITKTVIEYGNVGIGITSSIGGKLHVNNPDATPNTRFSRGTGYIFDLKIDNIITNSAIDYIIEPNQASSGILFRTHNSSNTNINALAINRDGNVGIDTTSPDGNLEVIASTVVSGVSDTVNNVLIGLQTTNRPTIILDTADTTYTNRTWNITNVGSQGSLYIGRNGLDSLILKNDGKLQFNAYGSGTFTGTATQRLAVDSSGNVIEVPIGSGAVDGSGAANKVTYWTDTDTISYNSNFHWDNTNGNLGIGTDVPNSTLHVYTTAEATARFQSTDNKAEIYVYDNDTTAILGAENANIYLGSSTGSAAGFLRIATTTGSATFGAVPEGNTRLKIVPRTVEIASNSTNYQKAVYASGLNFYDINSGVTDSGYRIAVDASAFVSDADFEGTLANQYAIWARHGANVSAAGSTITRSIGVYIDSLTNANTTITNLYGLYQEDSVAKNYFSGSVGIGTTSSGSKLHVNGGSKYFGGGDWTTIERVTTAETHYALYVQTTGTNTNQAIARFAYGTSVGGANTGTAVAAIAREKSYFLSKLGIGTTVPNNDLVVSDGVQSSYTPAVAGEYIEIARTSGGDAGFLINKNTGQWLFGIDNSDGTNPPLRFEYSAAGSAHAGFGNATLGLALKYDGNVGIGTADPDQKLEVSGNQRISSNGLLEFFGGTVYPQISRNTASGGLIIDTAGGGVSNSVPLLSVRENGGTDFVTVLGSGYVGIGTTSPTLGKLQVAGRGYFGPVGTGDATTKALMDTYSVLKLKPHNTNSTNMTFAQVNGGAGIGIQVTNGTQTADWDIALNPYGGNVGIGTTDPRGPLEVHAASDSTLIIEKYTANGIQLRADNSVNSAIRLGFEAYTYEFKNGSGTSRLHIDANGNVGIGTVTPSQKLHVQGSLRVTGAYYDSNNESGTSGQVLTSTGSATDWKDLDEISGVTASNPTTTNYVTKWSDGTNEVITDSLIYDNGTNIGIGTPSPAARLQVNQAASDQSGAAAIKAIGTAYGTNKTIHAYMGTTSNTKSLFYAENSNGVVMNIAGDGNVGIGATTVLSAAKLDVRGNIFGQGFNFSKSGSIIGANITLTNQAGDASSNDLTITAAHSTNSIVLRAAQKVEFYTYASGSYNNRLTILNNGNVGIGTTSPGAKLAVQDGQVTIYDSLSTPTYGDGSQERLRVGRGASQSISFQVSDLHNTITAYQDESASETHRFILDRESSTSGIHNFHIARNGSYQVTVDRVGNVGIGTTNPNQKLHVSGGSTNLPIIRLQRNDTSVVPDDLIGGFENYSNDADGAFISSYIKGYATETYGRQGYLTFGTAGTNSTDASEKMRIKADGNVGIGTTNPK